jgi:hypothetical protein
MNSALRLHLTLGSSEFPLLFNDLIQNSIFKPMTVEPQTIHTPIAIAGGWDEAIWKP